MRSGSTRTQMHKQCYSARQAMAVQRISLLPYMHSQLRACLLSSARTSASAAAKRCTAAALASARARST
jgi:hypothetical protein